MAANWYLVPKLFCPTVSKNCSLDMRNSCGNIDVEPGQHIFNTIGPKHVNI